MIFTDLPNKPHSQSAWADFKNRVETHLLDDDLVAACQGAKELFTFIVDILEALDPEKPEKVPRKVHATAFNPEAGSHGVVQEDKEIRAVIEASESVRKKMPYLEMRFGERGLRYTRSDGAWLATLVNFSTGTTVSQVEWLAKILSPIGVSRYALEVHLRESERFLKAVDPDKSKIDDYQDQ